LSFILDALRKSEHERQRQAGPSIADLPIARQAARTPPWVWVALGALLTVNVIVVAWLLLREPRQEPVVSTAPTVEMPAPAATATAPGDPAAAPVEPQPVPDDPQAAPAPAPAVTPQVVVTLPREVRPLTEEAAIEAAPYVDYYPAPESPDPALLPMAPAQAPPAMTAPAATGSRVPTIDELPPQATAGLPQLSLDLHIYAADPAQRAVFINGGRYRQGDALPQGVTVQQITPEGAVLTYRGQRFLLPRL
jgi:general secretion pathway protein B